MELWQCCQPDTRLLRFSHTPADVRVDCRSMDQKRTNPLRQDWHTNKTTLLRKCVIVNTAHPQLSLGVETPPGALPMPSHCHLLAPARGWSPTFWMSTSRLSDVFGGRESYPSHKGQAGLSHHRASPGCPCGATRPRSQAATTQHHGGASPPASSGAEQGHGWARVEQAQHPFQKPGSLQDPPSLSTKTLLSPCSGGEARGRHFGQPEKPPRERGAAAAAAATTTSTSTSSPSVRPAGRGRKGFMELGDCYLLK